MMKQKTVVMINGKAPGRFNYYNFAELKKHNMQFYALVGETIAKKIPLEHRAYFKEMIPVNMQLGDHGSVELDLERCIAAVESIKKKNPEDQLFVLSVDEGAVYAAAKLREYFSLSGATYQEVLPFRDKALMKKKLLAGGIRVPKFLSLEKQADAHQYYQYLVKELDLPFLIKALDKDGCEGLVLVNELQDFMQFNEEQSSFKDFQAEEFVSGEHYQVDILMKEDKMIFAQCGEFIHPIMDFLQGKNVGYITMPDHDDRAEPLKKFSERIAHAFLRRDGIIGAIEIIWNKKNELIFIEAAARASGAEVVPIIEHATGVNMADIDLKIETHTPFTLVPGHTQYMFSALLPKVTGKVAALNLPPIKSQYELVWSVKVGDQLHQSAYLHDGAGSLLAWNTDYDILREDFEKMKNFQSLKVV